MFEKIRKLIGHTVVYGIGNSGNRLVGFFLLPVYSRYLTPHDYGVLALVGMLAETLYILMNMGQSSALFRTYFLRDAPEERETVVTTALWLILTLSFPVGLLALALAKPLASLVTGGPGYLAWVMLGIGGAMFRALLRMPLAVLRAREASRQYALSAFAQTVAGLALAIIFVVGLRLGGRGVLLSQLVAEVLLCALLLPATLRGLRLTFSRRDARDMLGYGIYLMPTAFCSFLLQLSDRYFLKHYASLSVVGIYALGHRFGEALAFPMRAFELAWPQFLFGHQKSPEAPALYARVFTYLLAALGLVWLGVSLLAREIVVVLLHPAFHEAHRVVPWIAGALLVQSLNYAGNVGINLHRKVRYRPVILATAAALNLALNFLLIPGYGMMGAAVSAFATYLFQSSLRLVVSYRLYPVPYEYARIGRLVLVVGGLYVLGTLTAWGSVWAALAGKTVLLLSAPVLLALSGFLDPGEVRRLKTGLALWRRRRRGAAAAGGVTG